MRSLFFNWKWSLILKYKSSFYDEYLKFLTKWHEEHKLKLLQSEKYWIKYSLSDLDKIYLKDLKEIYNLPEEKKSLFSKLSKIFSVNK